MYGKELILDLHDCDITLFNRAHMSFYLAELCKMIDMERGPLHFWDFKDDPEGFEKAPPHLKGMSLVQFISTSNITIHALHDLKALYLNLFSCKDFKVGVVKDFTMQYFNGIIYNSQEIERI